MVILTCKCMSTSLYISVFFMLHMCIYSRCRKHWPALRIVNVSEQTHAIDFYMYVCVCINIYMCMGGGVRGERDRGEKYILI